MLLRLSLIFFFVLALGACLVASQGQEHEHGPRHLRDITEKLIQHPLHQPEVFHRALEILESIDSAPSCHRLATLSLIDSCQSLERTATAELVLTKLRETYAARLAVCELTSARVSTPTQCSSFIPSETGCQKSFSVRKRLNLFRTRRVNDVSPEACYSEATMSQVKRCLGALHSRPQWWTSYSNALQNVFVVCQASRSSIEKDEILEVFRSTTEVTAEVASALAQSLQMTSDFSSAVEKMKGHMLEEWEKQAGLSKTMFKQLVESIQNAASRAFAVINAGVAESSATIAENSAKLDESSIKLSLLQEHLMRTHELISTSNSGLKTMHDATVNRNIAVERAHLVSLDKILARAGGIEKSLQSVIQADIPMIDNVLNTYADHLRVFTELMAASTLEVERRVAANTEKLEQQANAIHRLRALSGSPQLWLLAILGLLFTPQSMHNLMKLAISMFAFALLAGLHDFISFASLIAPLLAYFKIHLKLFVLIITLSILTVSVSYLAAVLIRHRWQRVRPTLPGQLVRHTRGNNDFYQPQPKPVKLSGSLTTQQLMVRQGIYSPDH